MRCYVSGWKLGDLVYSIPAVIGGGFDEVILREDSRDGRMADQVRVFGPLLDVVGVRWRFLGGCGAVVADASWVDGEPKWGRRPKVFGGGRWREANIAEVRCDGVGVSRDWAGGRWLDVWPRRAARVVFCRSARYRPSVPNVDWRRLIRYAGGDGVFLGLAAEYQAFKTEFGFLGGHLVVDNFLQVARVLAGADLVVGNQTGIVAVANGLGVPLILERCERIDNCRFDRGTFWDSSDAFFGGPVDDGDPAVLGEGECERGD